MLTHPSTTDQVDLRPVFRTLRRCAPLLLLAPVLAGGGAYLLARQQPPVYEATASVIALENNAQNPVINTTLVTAPPLPPGAVEHMVRSRQVRVQVAQALARSTLKPQVVQRITRDLNRELAQKTFTRLRVDSQLDNQQRGVYEVTARAETPEAARLLAQSSVDALLRWDTDRAKQGAVRARRSLQTQLQNLTDRLQRLPVYSPQRPSLLTAQAQVLQNLSQVAVLETAATGTLVLAEEPVAPLTPVAPQPVRNATLAGLLGLFLAVVAALVLDGLRRRVSEAMDLASFGVPLVGQLPRLRRRELRAGFVSAGRSGALAESVGFLRINVLSALKRVPCRVVVSSTHAGEGKSFVTATLAESLGNSGLRVLVVDADLRRPTQLKIWMPQRLGLQPLPGSTPGVQPATTLQTALQQPDAAHAIRVSARVDLLPADAARTSTPSDLLGQPAFMACLNRWSEGYDCVLIDTPPMLSLPDTLVIAPTTDGVVMVVERGRTQVAEIARALDNARTAGIHVVGFVLNKAPRQAGAVYKLEYATDVAVGRAR